MKQKIFLLITTLLLAACGRNSGSSVNPSPTPAPGPIPSAQARFAYVLNSGDDSISQFSIGTSGELTPLTTTVVATGNFPRGMTMNAAGSHLYVANMGESTISQYSIGADGGLISLSSPIGAGPFPDSLVISPDGKFLYSVEWEGSLSLYSIGANGALNFLSSLALPNPPVSMTFSPSGKFVYVVNMDASISQFSVNADGTIAPLIPASVTSSGCPSGPLGMKKTSSGTEVIYVLSCVTSEIEVFSVAAAGTLTSQQIVSTGFIPESLQIFGENVYTTNLGDSTMSMFSIQSNGNLRPLAQATVATSDLAMIVAVDPFGGFGYVVDVNTSEISHYSVAEDGGLVPASRVPTGVGSGPRNMILKY